MNRTENVRTKTTTAELSKEDAEVNHLIEVMSENEGREREEREKKYVSTDERAASEFERGFAEGVKVG
jgi:hypothetical protein